MTVDKKSPNTSIDKAIKDLLKQITPAKKANGKDDVPLAPDEIRATAAAIAVAISWEKTKHNIKDDEEFNPDA